MQGILTVFVFTVLLAPFSKAQPIPIVDVNAEWSIATEAMGEFTNKDVYRFYGDTVINGITYKALYSSPDSTQQGGRIYQAGLREDQGKVWMYYRTDSMQRLIYDMTIGVGDSVKVYPANVAAGVTLFVDSIRQKNYGGSQRKVIYLRDRGSLFTETWIEGIGSVQGVLYPAYSIVVLDLGYALVCYKHNGNLLYFDNENFDDCYDDPNSVRETDAKPFVKFFPNPTYGKLYLEWQQDLPFAEAELRMYDSRGRMVLKQQVKTKDTEPVQLNLHPGIYFFKLMPEKAHKPITGKLMVK